MTTLGQELGEIKVRLDPLEAMVRSLAGDVHTPGPAAAVGAWDVPTVSWTVSAVAQS
jgi:hypothetical protein